jgi:hypothetical protein
MAFRGELTTGGRYARVADVGSTAAMMLPY